MDVLDLLKMEEHNKNMEHKHNAETKQQGGAGAPQNEALKFKGRSFRSCVLPQIETVDSPMT